MKNRRIAWALVMFAGLASGCAGIGQDPGSAQEPPGSSVAPEFFLFEACNAFHTTFPADSEKVAASLPRGYAPAEPSVAAVLNVLHCESAVYGNETVLAPHRLAMVGVQVRPPGSSSPAVEDVYVLEIFADHPSACLRWQEAGFPCHGAEIDVSQDGAQLRLRILSAGHALYDLTGAGQPGPQDNAGSYLSRVHFVVDGHGNVAVQETATNSGWPGRAGVLSAEGGAVAGIALGPGPYLANTVNQHEVVRFTFDAANESLAPPSQPRGPDETVSTHRSVPP